MSAQRTGIRLSLTLAVCTLLAACAAAPTVATKPVPTPATVFAHPDAPPATPAPMLPQRPTTQPWASLTASFVMQDCADSPLIRANAAMYTRSPARFEQHLQTVLPLILYVQEQLRKANIPGEFAMLPMLESSYNPAEPSIRGNAGGMWQMLPATGRHHGLTINRGYDGLLDPVASTQAAIRMLKSLYREFGDWRLVDMAYNAGPYAILAALRNHPDTSDPIPNVTVSQSSRIHLARLMALSCIIRDPARFEVSLPVARPADQLQALAVPAGTSLRQAAELAGSREADVRALNPGYRGATVTADSPRKLLLPAESAQTLAAALAIDASDSVAQVSAVEQHSRGSDPLSLPAEPTPTPDEAQTDRPAATPRATRHRVREGETLWSIARHFHVSVHQLKRWNDLRGDAVRPGEELRVQG